MLATTDNKARRVVGSIWEELKARGYAAIEDLPGTSESLTLEFKRKSSPERPGLSDDDRKGIAETLSGMSNAVGGVILFGIIDRKEGGLDVAEAAQDCDLVLNSPFFAVHSIHSPGFR